MIYDYQCNDCQTRFEIIASFQTISGIQTSCPNCNSKNVKRIYRPFNFILKGKGFYKTDNKQGVKSG